MTIPADLPAPGTEYLRLVLEVDLRLLAVTERVRQHWATHAASMGLSGTHIKVLLNLAPGEAVTMRTLARRMNYDASNLTTVVDRLELRGVVERRAHPHDRRVKALALTAEGDRLRAAFWHDFVTDPGPLGPLGESELRNLARLLAALEPARDYPAGSGFPPRRAAESQPA
jgi:DNA-binding MarR family transcriptional regulator